MKEIPLEIASEVGCTKNMIYKINRGLRRPAPVLAIKIIKAMKNLGQDINITDLRPDIAELFCSAAPDAE
jgi:DNA-binding XRE family transcriptional regulator